jgi:uncharacterized YccA/Bax inhibitor family protein
MRENRFKVDNPTGEAMTLGGSAVKTFILLVLVFASAIFTWRGVYEGSSNVIPLTVGALVGSLIIAFIIIFYQKSSPYLAPVYAVLQGLVLGGVSAACEQEFGGIVLQAILLTFGILLAMLMIYATGAIQPSHTFKLVLSAATGGILFVYLMDVILRFFGMEVAFLHSNGWIGIGISVIIVIVAALNFILDFDLIESRVRHGSPKYMEWYAAFGLIVTIIWLYLEVLRLLAKTRRR